MYENGMKQNQSLLESMVWIGCGASLATVLLRVWLLPAMADWQTGIFNASKWTIVLMLGALVVLAVLRYFAGPFRREITGTSSVATAIALMLAGAVMVVVSVTNFLSLYGALPNHNNVSASQVLTILEYVFCLLGGGALLRLGWALLSEGATRRGIAQWSVLAPVGWAWVRLVGYEMSYASMVRLEDNFFGVMMLIVEVLFLFRLARYVSGIGRVGAASLTFHAMATVMFTLSGVLTRVGMFLLQDNRAYSAYQLAGPLDLAIGILALVVGISLLSGDEVAQPVVEPPSGPSDTINGDVSATSAAEGLFLEEDAAVEEET